VTIADDLALIRVSIPEMSDAYFQAITRRLTT
jgi:hypothetical protein